MGFLDDLKKKASEFAGKVQEAAGQELKRREAAGQDVSTTSTRESVRETVSKAFEPVSRFAQKAKEKASYYDFSANQQKKWYKGDTPTHSETLARIYQMGEEDPSQREELWGLYQQEAANPSSVLHETYGQATSQYLTALGLDPSTQIDDNFIAGLTPYLDAAVHTSTGGLSTAKKNGADAVFAANVSGLISDYQDTKELLAEQEQAAKEAQYWIAKGLTDDEIKAKLNIGGEGSKYKKLTAALTKTQIGGVVPTTSAVPLLTSYGMDGMLYALRNPDSSTGDFLTDAVQKELGRGVKQNVTEADKQRRTPGSETWAPYSNGTTMDDEGIRFGVTQFDKGWLDENRAAILGSGDEDAIAAYGRIYNAEERTLAAESELEALNADIALQLQANPTQDADALIASLFYDAEGKAKYATLAEMDETLLSGKVLDMTRGIGYNRKEIEENIRAAISDAQLREKATVDPAAMNEVVEKEKAAAAEENGGSLIKPGSILEGIPEAVNRSVYGEYVDPNVMAEGWTWILNGIRNLTKKEPESEEAPAPEQPDQAASAKPEPIATIASAGMSDVKPSAPKPDEETQQFLDKWFDGKMPTDDEFADKYNAVLNDPSVPDEDVKYFFERGTEIVGKAQDEEDAYQQQVDEAQNVTTELAEQAAAVPALTAEEAQQATALMNDFLTNGQYAEAASLQFSLLTEAVTGSDNQYVREMVTSVGGQEAAMQLANLVLEGDMLSQMDDPTVREALTNYENYIWAALDAEPESRSVLTQALDFVSGGAVSATEGNEGVGLFQTMKSATVKGMAGANDVWATLVGTAMTGYGHVVKGTNEIINSTLGELFGFNLESAWAEKTIQAGQDLSNYYQAIGENEDLYLRENATALEYLAATAGGEAIKMGAQSFAGAAIGGKVTDTVGKIMKKGGFKQLATALDLSKVEMFTSKIVSASPFIADSFGSEFQQTYAETENPAMATLSALVSAFSSTALMNMDAIKNIGNMGAGKTIKEVVDALTAIPGSGMTASFKRYGKAGMMYIGNLFKTAANEAIQEPTENLLTTWATDAIKGKNFFDRDIKEFGQELVQDAFYAAIGTLGNSLGSLPSWSRSAVYADEMMAKTGLTQQDVRGAVEAFIADTNDPQVMAQLQANLNEAATQYVTGELLSQGALGEVNAQPVIVAQEKLEVSTQKLEETVRNMEITGQRLATAKERFNANPADPKATAAMLAAIDADNKAVQANQAAQTVQAQAQAKVDEASAQLKKTTDAAMEAVRAKAAETVEQSIVEVTVAKEEAELQSLPYSERFSKEFDKWDKKQIGKEFVVGHTSDTLLSLGVPDADINLLSDKLIKIQKKHPAMTDEVIKQIPNIIENPVVVMKSRTVPDRLTMFGEVMDANGNPVLAIIDTSMKANTKTGRIDIDVIRLNSAYGKDTDAQGFIDRSEVVYVDKNRADNWSRSTRLYLPIGEDTNGSDNSIAQNAETVNSSISIEESNDTSQTGENVNSESTGIAPDPQGEIVPAGGDIIPPDEGAGTQPPSEGTGKRQFATQTLQSSDAMPEWLKQELRNNPAESDYEIDSNYRQAERAWNTIQQNGYEQERDRLLSLERFSADDTAEANLLMAMANHNGDAETLLSIASAYNKEGTKAGQELQARKLFSKMSPTGAKAFVAGQAESRLSDFLTSHKTRRDRLNDSAQRVEQSVLALPSAETSTDNRWGVELNAQQQELIRHYRLENVARPGLHYNRATTKQRMLEAIIATPSPTAMTGNGLNLIQRLEYMDDGLAVVTNADLDYIGTQLGQFVGLGGEAGGRDADLAVSRAYEAFGNITPATGREKTRTWRYTSMLLSVSSAIRNVMGNAAQNIENATAHGVASMVDRALAKVTGQRTVANINMQERIDGWRGFVDETKNTFRDYFVDQTVTERGEAKYNTHQRGRVYQSNVLETMRNAEGFLMSVGDRNFWRKAYLNSIAEQQRLADLNGTTITMEEMEARAEADANYATFTEDSRVRDALSQFKQIPLVGDALDFIIPFTGVPLNITKRMWQYSPFGLASTALQHGYQAAVRKAASSETVQSTKLGRKLTRNAVDFDQRAFVMSLSRGLTGTALFGVGMALAKMGAIKLGTGDEDDSKKYGLRSAMGEQYTPYVYNPFTDEYVSLHAFAPAVSPLIMGVTAADIFAEDEDAWMAVQNAALASIDQIFDASFMSGLSDLFSSYGSPGEKIANAMFTNAVSQSVPALLSQLANSLDPYVRDTKDSNWIMQALKSGLISRIPGLRQLLPEKVDVTGQTVRTKEGWRNFFDPFTTTDVNDDPALQELIRLSDGLGESTFLPSDALSGSKTTLTVNSQKVALNGDQKEAYKKRYGELWLEGGTTINKKGTAVAVMGVRPFMESPAYQTMTDEDRAKEIQKIVKAAKEGASMEMLNEVGPDPEEE